MEVERTRMWSLQMIEQALDASECNESYVKRITQKRDPG